jgi:hypothetical protein
VATWNGVKLELKEQARVGTGYTSTEMRCLPPQWQAPAPAPAAEDVISVGTPEGGIEAAFPAPAATFELLDPADGVLNRLGPLNVSIRLAIDPAFPRAVSWPPGPLILYLPCPGLEIEYLKEGEPGRYSIRFRPGIAPAGTYTCTAVLNYEVKASRCTAKDCVLHYGGAPIRSVTAPDTFVSFQLTLR